MALGLTVLFGALAMGACSSDAPSALPGPETSATVISSEALIPLGEVIQTVEVAEGEQITDAFGNRVVVHGWAPWPDAVNDFSPYANTEMALFGNIGYGRPATTALIAVDIEVCAAPNQPADQELFRSRFQPTTQAGEALDSNEGDLRALMIFQPLLHPAFVWPSADDCSRGWQGLAWTVEDSGPGGAQYTAVSTEESTFGDQYVYRWMLDDAVPNPGSPAPISLAEGLAGAFQTGQLAGTNITVVGWTSVPNANGRRAPNGSEYAATLNGAELIAVLIEACAGTTGSLPELGLQVDGWNLIGRFNRGVPWGVGFEEISPPQPGDCTTGWIAFEAPLGVEPTAVFATNTFDPDAPWIEWPLGDTQLNPPTTISGFPDDFLMESVMELCGATDPLDVSVVNDAVDLGPTFDPVSAVAVASNSRRSRIVIYLSEQVLAPTDIPSPEGAGESAVVLVLENGEGSSIEPGTFTSDFTSASYGDASVAASALGDGLLLFGEPSIEVTELTDDYLCGTVSAPTGDNQIVGRFGAPLWSPTS